ncbi:uncharacterized protein [Aegilops tauschii subsp. strangulata]|uniref:uncharacterized protein n=1 Tax=Aegilops tauschii subsp. strangulata TaxID=200361 RepID=UPI00098BA3BD|nr:uncharacterized protein LOC109783891 [Aegilops tauschii subsp. strangulata]
MAAPSSSKDKFFERVINPYLLEVMKHPQAIEMRERVLHIRDVQRSKKAGTVEARLEAVEQEIFKCQGVVEHGLNANHLMITEFTHDQKVDGLSMKDIIFTFNEQIIFLQSQIYDLQNQVFEYEARSKGMSLAASCRTRETHASSYDGETLPWKPEDRLATTSSPPPPSSFPSKET